MSSLPLSYSEIYEVNADFQKSINLSLDIGNIEYVKKYIPTKASVAVIDAYIDSVIKRGGNRSSILIGPYGKGKSHTLFVVVSILSDADEKNEKYYSDLIDRINVIDPSTAEKIRTIRNNKVRLLPVIVNDRYLDIRQAFLASLREALLHAGLERIMPENYYQCCLDTINRWNTEYPATYSAYVEYIHSKGEKTSDFESQIAQFNPAALELFRDCHRIILSGAEFDPLLSSDVASLYSEVAQSLKTESRYNGLFIVFDEFGKYLESVVSYFETPKFKVLQDIAEICDRSKNIPMLISCISHKAISEYATRLNTQQKSSFRTVEGRFNPIYFTSTFEGTFSLISGALGCHSERLSEFMTEHEVERKQAVAQIEDIGCFSGYDSNVNAIVDMCFPMHPITALALMRLSEKAAQNERTLFTFLSQDESPLVSFIKRNDGAFEFATVDLVYDYFHETIRETSYDEEIKELVVYADSIIPRLQTDEKKLVKAVALFAMISDSGIQASKEMLAAALQWSSEEMGKALSQLEQSRLLYVRRSDGVLCLMRSNESIRHEIEHEMELRRGRVPIEDQLSALIPTGYTIPRRYNDQHEIVRYFQNVYISTENFLQQNSFGWLEDIGFADGYVLYLLGYISEDQVYEKIKQTGQRNIVVILSKTPLNFADAIEEGAAIKRLLEKIEDPVTVEELTYYYEDILSLVNRHFTEMFAGSVTCVSTRGSKAVASVGAEVSSLCEEVLYPKTPRICHEMINRSDISGIMRQVRSNVINAVLANGDVMTAFDNKSAEGAIVRSVLGQMGQNNMKAIMEEIQRFLSGCEAEKQPIQRLYEALMAPPYGMRKGVIPLLLAYGVREFISNVTLYNEGQEMAFDGETLKAFDSHYSDYSILIDKGSADQSQYISILHERYAPDDATINIRSIHDSMSRLVRALPRCARTNKQFLSSDGSLKSIDPAWINVRQALLRYGSNSRDTLLSSIPRAISVMPSKVAAEKVIGIIDGLSMYCNDLQKALSMIICRRLGYPQRSIHGAMTLWLQNNANRLNHVFDAATTALINVFRSEDNHTEREWIDMTAVALTGLPLEDWSDQQMEAFQNILNETLLKIETVEEDSDESGSDTVVSITLEGKEFKQALKRNTLDGLATVALNSVQAALDEFGDAITNEEKILILTKALIGVTEGR